MVYLYDTCDQISDFCYQVTEKNILDGRKDRGKTLYPPSPFGEWGYKYQISAINSCWKKCDEKWAYMFNMYKNQQSRQTGSRNLTSPKKLPTIWYTYMTLVTKYQIAVINSYWKKCDEKYLGRTDRGKTVNPPPPLGSGGIIMFVKFFSGEELLKFLLPVLNFG